MKWQLLIMLGVLMTTSVTATSINLLEEQNKLTFGVWLSKNHYVITLEDNQFTEAHLDLINEKVDYELKTDRETIYQLAWELPRLNKEERIYLIHKKLGIPINTLEGIVNRYEMEAIQ